MAQILCVDDHTATLDMLECSLALEGHEVLRASDGAQAIALARDARPDLVIMDWMMPDVDGLTAVHALRDDPDLEGLPVIMLTAKGTDEDLWHGWRAGVDSYITKPLDFLVLLDEMARLGVSSCATALPA